MTIGPETLRSRILLEQLPLVTYIAAFDEPYSVEYVSPQIEALLGYAPAEWVSNPEFWLGQTVADDREIVLAACAAVRETHDPVIVEYRLLARDGRAVWVRDVAMVVTVDGGSENVQGFLTDITHEKELEILLARERARTDAFFRDSTVGMAITDAEGRFVRVNEALARMNGLTPHEHVGRQLREIAPLIADGVEPLLESVWRTGEPVQGHELTVEVAPGETTNSLVSYFPVDSAGAKRFGGIVIDVTDLHRALREGAEAEHQYRQLVEQLPLVLYSNTLEPDVHTTYVSPQVEQLFGYAPRQWIAESDLWGRVVHPDDLGRVRQEEAARIGNEPLECEYRIVRPDGTIRSVLDIRHTVLDEAGIARFEQGFVIDVTDRKRAEQAKREALDALRESEAQFRSVFDNALDAMVIVNDEGAYVDVNPAACELFGRTRDELVSLSAPQVSSALGSELGVWREFLVQGTAVGATTITRGDGTSRDTEFSATANVQPGRHLSILRDVTGRKLLERALWQAQKLESVGALAGGVAHDFNNMLTAINGYSQLLLARLAPGSIERGHAEEIERAAERAAKLTAQLLAFGRRQVLQPREIDLNELVTELSPMLSRVVGPEVVFDVESEGEPRTVRADPAQVAQVILNIVLNASEAMTVGGRVTIRTRNVDIDDDVEATKGATARELAGGTYVELSIGDSGHGMDADMLEHVFEPFFTTKEIGLGDGLGLSTAYGIVKQSGGTIVAESRAGTGAMVRVYLPVAGLTATT